MQIGEKVVIPTTIAAATKVLEGIESLLTAKGWERAAIVYAFTKDARVGRPAKTDEKSSISIDGFAARGISGLTTKDSVRRYRSLWEEYGDPDIGPGSTVILPDLDFPPTRTGTDGFNTSDGMEATLSRMVEKHGVEPVAQAVANVEPEIVDRADQILRDRTPDVPEREHKLYASDVQTEVARLFGRAYTEIEAANDLLAKAIREGIALDDLAFDAMATYPETYLDEIVVAYRKTLAMLPTRVME